MNQVWWTSRATPTTVIQLLVRPSTLKRRPIGSSSVQYRRAIVSLTIATGSVPAMSPRPKSRPAVSRIRIVSEVARRREAEVGAAAFGGVGDRVAFDLDRTRRVAHRRRRDVDERRAFDAEHAARVVDQRLEERAPLVRRLVPRAEQRHPQRHHAVGVVAVVAEQHRRRAAHAEPGGDEQRQRQRDLDDHHRVAEAMASAAAGGRGRRP